MNKRKISDAFGCIMQYSHTMLTPHAESERSGTTPDMVDLASASLTTPIEERVLKVIRDRLKLRRMSQVELAAAMAEALPDHKWDQSRINKWLWRQIPIDIGTLEVAARAVGLSLLELLELAASGTVTRRELNDDDAYLLELLRRADREIYASLRTVIERAVEPRPRRRGR